MAELSNPGEAAVLFDDKGRLSGDRLPRDAKLIGPNGELLRGIAPESLGGDCEGRKFLAFAGTSEPEVHMRPNV